MAPSIGEETSVSECLFAVCSGLGGDLSFWGRWCVTVKHWAPAWGVEVQTTVTPFHTHGRETAALFFLFLFSLPLFMFTFWFPFSW